MAKQHLTGRLQTIAKIAANTALGITAASFAFRSYWIQHYIGFPDGFVTEFGQVQKVLLLVFMLLNILFCCFYLSLPFFAKKSRRWKRLAIGLAVHLILIALFFAINHYLYLKLDHGIGA